MKNDVLTCSITGGFVLPLIGILALHYYGSQPQWLAMTEGGQQFSPTYITFLFSAVIVGAFIGSALSILLCSKDQHSKPPVINYGIGWLAGSLIGSALLYQTIGFLNYFSPLLICLLGFSASALVLWAGLVKHKI